MFFFLSGFRHHGMSGPLPIALSEIIAYAELIGYTAVDDKFFLIDLVHACDKAYLKKYYDDQNASQAAAKTRRPVRR